METENWEERHVGSELGKDPCPVAMQTPSLDTGNTEMDIPGTGCRLQYKIAGLQILLNCPLQKLCNFPLLATLHHTAKLAWPLFSLENNGSLTTILKLHLSLRGLNP